MDGGQILPAGFAVPQQLVDSFTCVRVWGVGVQPGRFIDHQQVFIFMKHARKHGRILALLEAKCRLPEVPGASPKDPEAEQEVGDCVGGHGIAEPGLADHQPLVSQPAENARDPTVRMQQAKN